MDSLPVTKLSKWAYLPTRKHASDAGLDLYACLRVGENEPENLIVVIQPHSYAIVPTKIAVKIPEGYAGFIWPKSRNDYLIGGGVVDAGYTGEILVKVMNTSESAKSIYHGDAVGQLIIQPVETPELFELVNEAFYYDKTDRGNTGGILSQYKQASFTSVITDVE